MKGLSGVRETMVGHIMAKLDFATRGQKVSNCTQRSCCDVQRDKRVGNKRQRGG